MSRALLVLTAFAAFAVLPLSGARAGEPESKAKSGKQADKRADEERRARLRYQRNQRILSREELEAAMAAHVPAIRGCYEQHAAKQETARGEVRLEMLIRPEGTIQRLWTVAPGVRGKALGQCIDKLSKGWRFPKKPGFTNAVMPFFFLKTNAKGAGPLHSCWSAKGCPEKRRRNKK